MEVLIEVSGYDIEQRTQWVPKVNKWSNWGNRTST